MFSLFLFNALVIIDKVSVTNETINDTIANGEDIFTAVELSIEEENNEQLTIVNIIIIKWIELISIVFIYVLFLKFIDFDVAYKQANRLQYKRSWIKPLIITNPSISIIKVAVLVNKGNDITISA